MYADEVSPGNILKVENHRKMYAFYVAVKQLGPLVLKHESCWLPLAVLRTTELKKIKGGVGAALVVLLERMFVVEKIKEHDGGVMVDIGAAGGFARLFFRFSNLLGDGDALRALLWCKGASGKLPCLCCKNIVRGDCAASTYLQPVSCIEPALFDLATDAEVFGKADILAEAFDHLGAAQFDELSTAMGISHNPHGLLMAKHLRPYAPPVSILTYDSMHTLLTGGLAQNEVGLLMDDLARHGIPWGEVGNFVTTGWHICCCSGHASTLKGMFSEARRKASKGGPFKCMASEMLLAMPILLHFLLSRDGLSEQLHHKVESFANLHNLVDLCKRAKGGGGQALSARLADAVKAHAQAFAIAYPDFPIKAKNHWAFHLPGQVERDGVLLDCFTGERKNQTIKQAANKMKNPRVFEKSVMVAVLAAQLSKLSEPDHLCDALKHPAPAPELAALLGFDMAAQAKAMTWRGTPLHSGDMLLINGQYQLAQAFALTGDGSYLLLGQAYRKLRQVVRVVYFSCVEFDNIKFYTREI